MYLGLSPIIYCRSIFDVKSISRSAKPYVALVSVRRKIFMSIFYLLQENGGQSGGGVAKTGQRAPLTAKMAMDSFRFSVLDQAGKEIFLFLLNNSCRSCVLKS